MNRFWENVIEGIDEKFINDTVNLHIRKMSRENILVPVEIEAPPPVSRRTLVIRTVLKIAAALAVVIGIGAVLKANDISVSEIWEERPSQTSDSSADATPFNTETTAETTIAAVTEPLFTTTVNPADTTNSSVTTTSVVTVQPPVEITGFDLLGDYYTGNDGLFHVSDENWEASDDFELFRRYFFGVWEKEDYKLIIDDSENANIISAGNTFFMEFYKVSGNVLALLCGGSAGGQLYWLDTNNPDILYNADGVPGDFPNGFSCNDNGEPIAWELEKTNIEITEPENGYLSVYRLREIAVSHDIDFNMLTDFGIRTENGTQYHDSRYYFFPMYLVSEADYRLEIKAKTGNIDTMYGGLEQAEVVVIFEKINDKWIRTVEISD